MGNQWRLTEGGIRDIQEAMSDLPPEVAKDRSDKKLADVVERRAAHVLKLIRKGVQPESDGHYRLPVSHEEGQLINRVIQIQAHERGSRR